MSATRADADTRALVRFGQRVRARRESLSLSQEQLAELAEFDRTYISMVERGMRNLSLLNVKRFAKALKMPLEELVKGI